MLVVKKEEKFAEKKIIFIFVIEYHKINKKKR